MTTDSLVPTSTAAPSSTPLGAKIAAAGLVLGAGGNLAQALLWSAYGGRPDTVEEQLAWAADHGTHFAAAVIVGTLAVPFMAIGFYAACRLLARKARIAGIIAGSCLLVGMWGFQAIQVAETIQLAAMFDNGTTADQAARWMGSMEESPLLLIFGVPFLLFAPLGLLVMTIVSLIKRPFPRWIAGAWLLFVVLDFGFTMPVYLDPHWLYFAAAFGLAVHLLDDSARAWVSD